MVKKVRNMEARSSESGAGERRCSMQGHNVNLIVLLILCLSTISAFSQIYPYVPPAPTLTGSGPGGISGTNLAVWYRSDNLTCTGGCSGTNVVTTLIDKSPNSNNCTTAGSPTYLASAVNSQPGITFTAASTQYCTLGSTVTWSGSVTVFAVTKCTAANTPSALYGSLSFNGFTYLNCSGSNHQQWADAPGVALIAQGTATSDTSYHQTGVTYDGTNYAFYIGSTTDGSGTNSVSILGNNTTVGVEASPENYLNSVLVEEFVYTRILTSGEISTVQAYLHSRYGT
jgi:hypothetical protein